MNRLMVKEFERKGFDLIIAAIVISFVVLGSGFMSLAKSNKIEEPVYKYFKSVEIEQGDSLWKIACENISEEYGSIEEYVDDIIKLNQLKSSEIHAGENIVVPYYLSELK